MYMVGHFSDFIHKNFYVKNLLRQETGCEECCPSVVRCILGVLFVKTLKKLSGTRDLHVFQ